MGKKSLSLTMDALLTVVKSEVLQLGSWEKERVVFSVQKKNDWESGEEILFVKVLREDKND